MVVFVCYPCGSIIIPLSGWLADAKFGNYKVFIVGAVLLFISAVMNCLFMILEELVLERDNVLKWVHLCSVSLLSVVGGCACMATALPLGLDQMPGASSANITSYIAWFVCSFFISSLLMEVLSLLKRYCLDEHIKSSFSLVLALFYSLCIGLTLISNFDFLCRTTHGIILYCWYKCWVGSETQCWFSTSMVSSHLILSENCNMFHWISPVLCCGSLVQDESER